MDVFNELIGYKLICGEPLPEPENKTVQLDGRTNLIVTSDRRIVDVRKIVKTTEQVWP